MANCYTLVTYLLLLRRRRRRLRRLLLHACVPVSVYVRRAEREAVVHQRWVDGESALGAVEQLVQVEQVSLASADAVPRAVLVQNEHLARVEPALHTDHIRYDTIRSINQSINVKFVGRRYTRRPGAPTVVSGTHDQKVHS